MSLEYLIEKSIEQQQAMIAHLAEMAELLKMAHPQAIKRALERWCFLQEEARQLDSQINEQHDALQAAGLSLQLQQRTELMTQINLRCQQIYSHANLLKVMVNDELSHLHQGRRAMGGYKRQGMGKGSRLTASF